MSNKELTKVLRKTAKDFHRIGLMDDQTMREFDAMCLPKVKQYTPVQIKKLNTNVSTIQKWEQGQKKPNGISLKLLSLIDRYGLTLLAA